MNINPVLERELRERPRTMGAVVMLTVYLALLAGVFLIVYQAEQHSAGTTEVVATSVARIGQGLFEWVLFTMLVLILFLVPGYTASAICGERERQTLIPMQLTMLRPWRIVSGKASASVAYLALLVVATTPLLALAYLIGGVSLIQVFRGLLAVLFIGVVLALVTVACSTVVRHVATGTLLAYSMTILLVFGTMTLWGGVTAIKKLNVVGPDDEYAPTVLAALNPVLLVTAAVDMTDPDAPATNRGATSPFAGMRETMHPQMDFNGGGVTGGPPVMAFDAAGNPVFDNGFAGNANANVVPGNNRSVPFPGFLPWSLFSYVVLGGLAWWLASVKLRTPAEIER